MKKSFFFLFFVFLPTIVFSADWKCQSMLLNNNSKAKLCVDKNSFDLLNHRGWFRIKYSKPIKAPHGKVKEVHMLIEANCSQQVIRELKTIENYTNGNVKDFDAGEWTYVAPDSTGHDILGILCQ